MYLQYNFQINILLQDSLQERDLTKISLNLKEFQLSRGSVGLDTLFAEINCYLSSYHLTGFVQDMMKCYGTNKLIPLQNAALIGITRAAKICFALFILIMSVVWYNASFVSLLN